MTKKLLLIALLLTALPTAQAENKPERSFAAVTIAPQKSNVLKNSLLKRFANGTKKLGARLGKNAWLRTAAAAGNTYHLGRHPINTLKRILGSAKLQTSDRKRLIPLLAFIVIYLLDKLSLLIKVPSTANPDEMATISAEIDAEPDLLLVALFPLLLFIAQAFYDNNLSSAQLRTKNWFRRLSGWLLRHRLTTPFGYDRGSVQNTERLLTEQAALPADADAKLRTIYSEELQDALDRFNAGSEDANPELQARVDAALAA